MLSDIMVYLDGSAEEIKVILSKNFDKNVSKNCSTSF